MKKVAVALAGAFVVAALAAERISVSELSLRLPSLDEVFYSLTGQTEKHIETKGAAA